MNGRYDDNDDSDDRDDDGDDNDDVLNNISSATDEKIFVFKKTVVHNRQSITQQRTYITVPLQELVEQVHFQIDHDKIQTEQYL